MLTSEDVWALWWAANRWLGLAVSESEAGGGMASMKELEAHLRAVFVRLGRRDASSEVSSWSLLDAG